MRPQFLLQQHVGTCSRTPKPLPRECSNTALRKTLLDGGTEVGENICLAAATAQTGANIFIWGAEDKSCDAELLCEGWPSSCVHEEPSTPRKPLARVSFIPFYQAISPVRVTLLSIAIGRMLPGFGSRAVPVSLGPRSSLWWDSVSLCCLIL